MQDSTLVQRIVGGAVGDAVGHVGVLLERKRRAHSPIDRSRNIHSPAYWRRNIQPPTYRSGNIHSPAYRSRNVHPPIYWRRNVRSSLYRRGNVHSPVKRRWAGNLLEVFGWGDRVNGLLTQSCVHARDQVSVPFFVVNWVENARLCERGGNSALRNTFICGRVASACFLGCLAVVELPHVRRGLKGLEVNARRATLAALVLRVVLIQVVLRTPERPAHLVVEYLWVEPFGRNRALRSVELVVIDAHLYAHLLRSAKVWRVWVIII